MTKLLTRKQKTQYIEWKLPTEELQDILELIGVKRDAPLTMYNECVINALYDVADAT